MRRRDHQSSVFGTVVGCAIALGCSTPRELPAWRGGMHAEGWADPNSQGFHAVWLRERGDPAAHLVGLDLGAGL